MSDILLAKQGIDPRVTELANKIKAAEVPEIQQMQDWLNQWGNPTMPAMTSGDTQMPAHGGMIGQLSERELNALREAKGADAKQVVPDTDDCAPRRRNQRGADRNGGRSVSSGGRDGAVDRQHPAAGDRHHEGHSRLAVASSRWATRRAAIASPDVVRCARERVSASAPRPTHATPRR